MIRATIPLNKVYVFEINQIKFSLKVNLRNNHHYVVLRNIETGLLTNPPYLCKTDKGFDLAHYCIGEGIDGWYKDYDEAEAAVLSFRSTRHDDER